MFDRLAERGREPVRITVDGEAVDAEAGESIAAALLAAGIARFRTTPVSGAPRAPYCMMGACFDCLVVVDGVANRQACMVAVRDGMRIERQSGARGVAVPQP